MRGSPVSLTFSCPPLPCFPPSSKWVTETRIPFSQDRSWILETLPKQALELGKITLLSLSPFPLDDPVTYPQQRMPHRQGKNAKRAWQGSTGFPPSVQHLCIAYVFCQIVYYYTAIHFSSNQILKTAFPRYLGLHFWRLLCHIQSWLQKFLFFALTLSNFCYRTVLDALMIGEKRWDTFLTSYK